jgi:formylmethanofuran dehydrogenase subunit A
MEAADEKIRKVQAATAQSLLRIIQSIPSPKAEPFKLWLAQVGSDRLDEIENPELATQRTMELYKLKGYPKKKGRLQVGADADITVFNAATITDKATFEKGLAFSEGVEYVLVNGVLVLSKGKTVAGIFPGQPVYGKFKK